ncbi:hypothetical protein [Micromonospora sp. NPDC049679]|uniref:hypothetical protein n=1 Tax=Micromonospora sp. NPDC049679 TaxID=3155920 RepID=UPI003408F810
MTVLEEAIREVFTSRVESPPVADDIAGRVIRRGRALRRRRSVGSSVAATLALALTLTGSLWLRGWSMAENAPTAGFAAGFDGGPDTTAPTGGLPTGLLHSTRIGLDLRVGDRLWTADGRKLALDGVGEIRRVYRVPAGWVYAGATEIRLLREDGSSIGLTTAASTWIVSPDGGRLALVADTVLQVGTIGPAGLTLAAKAAVPLGAAPVAFLGERIVIAGPSGQSTGYDYLNPGKTYKPTWNTEVAAVYGPHRDRVVGLVRRPDRQDTCLAAIEAKSAGLRVARTGACLPDLHPAESEGLLSPDGARLVEPGRDALTLLDVDRALLGQRVGVVCPLRTTVPPAWVDSATVIGADERGAVRCGTDGTQEIVPVPSDIGAGWRLVPRLTPVAAG